MFLLNNNVESLQVVDMQRFRIITGLRIIEGVCGIRP